MGKRYFGTDGIRGRVGQYPVTPDFMLKLGWAAGKVFAREGLSKILIGKDTRISGYMFESALEAGLSAAGVDVLLTGPMPTPAVAYLTRTFRANAGIVISASHNPHYDNGIKFFSSEGTKLPDEIEAAIEAQLDLEMTTVDPTELGKARRIDDAAGRYIEFCKATAAGLDLKGIRIVLDCANGATYHVAGKVLSELGADVISIGASPDGLNINDRCGATHTKQLQETVLQMRADVGIALDGDGDRLIMVDKYGVEVDGDELLYIMAINLRDAGELSGGVVGTLMSNFGLEQAFKREGIEFKRANVGDRYVMEMLAEYDWIVGGESSGHLICRSLTTTGDGTVSALQVLKAIVDSGKPLEELKAGMVKMPQTMINVKMAKKMDVKSVPAVQEAVAQVEATLGERGRVLLRPSGTEPVVRVMIEGEDAVEVENLCRGLAAEVEKVLNTLES